MVEKSKISSLIDLKVGESARILGFNPGNPHYRQRLLALGFIPERKFTIIRKAPLGDPIEVRLHNQSIHNSFCLRLEEAQILLVEPLLAKSLVIEPLGNPT